MLALTTQSIAQTLPRVTLKPGVPLSLNDYRWGGFQWAGSPIYSPSARFLAVGFFYIPRFWETTNGVPPAEVVTANGNLDLAVWDMSTGKQEAAISFPKTCLEVTPIAFDPTERCLWFVEKQHTTTGNIRLVGHWDLPANCQTGHPIYLNSGDVLVSASSGGDEVAIMSKNRNSSVTIYDRACVKLSCLPCIPGSASPTQNCGWLTVTGKLVAAVVSGSNSYSVWSIGLRQNQWRKLATVVGTGSASVRWSSGGTLFAVTETAPNNHLRIKGTRVFRSNDWTTVAYLPHVAPIMFSNDGKTLIVRKDSAATPGPLDYTKGFMSYEWIDTTNWRPYTIMDNPAFAQSVAFSSDLGQIAYCDNSYNCNTIGHMQVQSIIIARPQK